MSDSPNPFNMHSFRALSEQGKKDLLRQCMAVTDPVCLEMFAGQALLLGFEKCGGSVVLDLVEALLVRKQRIPYGATDYVNYLFSQNTNLAGRALSAWDPYCDPGNLFLKNAQDNKEALVSIVESYTELRNFSDLFRLLKRYPEPLLDCSWDLLKDSARVSLSLALENNSLDVKSLLQKNPFVRATLSKEHLIEGIPVRRDALPKTKTKL